MNVFIWFGVFYFLFGLGFSVFFCVFCQGLAIGSGGLKNDIFAADVKESVLCSECASAIIGLEVLDLGEALDGTEVGTALVHIFRDVDVANGAILLEDGAKLLDVDVAREVLGHQRQAARRECGHVAVGCDRRNTCGGLATREGQGALSQAGALAKQGALSCSSGLFGFTLFAEYARALLLLRSTEDIAPEELALAEGFFYRVFEKEPAELVRKGPNHNMVRGRLKHRLGGHRGSWKGLERLGRARGLTCGLVNQIVLPHPLLSHRRVSIFF